MKDGREGWATGWYISLEHWPAATLETGSSVTSDMTMKLTIVDVDERYRSRELNYDEGAWTTSGLRGHAYGDRPH
jgi:hypothetical protein